MGFRGVTGQRTLPATIRSFWLIRRLGSKRCRNVSPTFVRAHKMLRLPLSPFYFFPLPLQLVCPLVLGEGARKR